MLAEAIKLVSTSYLGNGKLIYAPLVNVCYLILTLINSGKVIIIKMFYCKQIVVHVDVLTSLNVLVHSLMVQLALVWFL